MRNFTELSTVEIGKIIGGKTHSTVLYSINKIDRDRNNDKEINNLITELMNKIKKIKLNWRIKNYFKQLNQIIYQKYNKKTTYNLTRYLLASYSIKYN